MLDHSYAMCKGISAVGKGTRFSHLMEFLKTKFSWHTIGYKDFVRYDGAIITDTPIGTWFPEINMYFLGRWVKSNKSGLISWSCLDTINSLFGKQYITELYLNIGNNKGHVLVEGYPMTMCKEYSPKWITENSNITNLFYQYFIYPNDIEHVQERVVGRSGKRIKGSCWGQNKMFDNECNNFMNNKEIMDKYNVHIDKCDYNIAPEIFGHTYLSYLQVDPSLVEEFYEWSKTNSTLRHISDKEGNHAKFYKYLNYKDWNYIDIEPVRSIQPVEPSTCEATLSN